MPRLAPNGSTLAVVWKAEEELERAELAVAELLDAEEDGRAVSSLMIVGESLKSYASAGPFSLIFHTTGWKQ